MGSVDTIKWLGENAMAGDPISGLLVIPATVALGIFNIVTGGVFLT